MSNQQAYIQNRVRLGWGLVIAGGVLFAAGLVLQMLFSVPFNARIVSGLGIFLAGVGAAQIMRYRAARADQLAAARLVNEERDERTRLIRAQAGMRAFWVSLGLTYIALMWLSLASSGSLPLPTLDELWYFLAAAVVVPVVVFIAGIAIGQNRS